MKTKQRQLDSSQRARGRADGLRWARVFMWITVPLLLWLALRSVDLRAIWQAVGNLTAFEVGVLVLVNLGALVVMCARWWIVIRAYGHLVPYPHLVAYRLAASAISYFTPGPQFGGEPLQVYLLRRRLSLRGAEAAATVALDKSIELVANFGFLLLGLAVLLGLGLFPSLPVIPVLIAAGGLLLLPVLHLTAAARGRRPLAALVRRLPPRAMAIAGVERLAELLAATEVEVTRFFAGRRVWFAATLVASAATWLVFVAEYWLLASFLGLQMSPLEAIAALTAARVAFMLPVPSGLGTLEASQVLAVAALGYPAATGAALALVIRARDVLFGVVGLVIGWLATGELTLFRRREGDAQAESE